MINSIGTYSEVQLLYHCIQHKVVQVPYNLECKASLKIEQIKNFLTCIMQYSVTSIAHLFIIRNILRYRRLRNRNLLATQERESPMTYELRK